MAYKRLAQVGSTCSGRCWAPNHDSVTDWTGIVSYTSGGFTISGLQAACVGDGGTTSCGHNFVISGGSDILTGYGGRIVAREGDPVIVTEGGDGVITSGSDICTSF